MQNFFVNPKSVQDTFLFLKTGLLAVNSNYVSIQQLLKKNHISGGRMRIHDSLGEMLAMQIEDESIATYCIMDTMQMSKVTSEWRNMLVDDNAEYYPLRFPASNESIAVAPHLVAIRQGMRIYDFLTEHAGKHLGIFVRTAFPAEALAERLTCARYVTLASGEKSWFRFYDPRVMRCFWNILTPEQYAIFYPDITTTYFAEDVINDILRVYHAELNAGKLPCVFPMRITPEQEEEFGKNNYRNFLYTVTLDAKKRFPDRSHEELKNAVEAITAWASDIGMVQEEHLHNVVIAGIENHWNKKMGDAIRLSCEPAMASDQGALKRYICNALRTMGERYQ